MRKNEIQARPDVDFMFSPGEPSAADFCPSTVSRLAPELIPENDQFQ
jgi:hypothetical protein